jgi:hypothetical protein
MEDIYKINKKFLADKGFILKPIGDTGLYLRTEDWSLYEDEWSFLDITNRKTGKYQFVCLVTQILTDDDFEKLF